MMKYAFRHFSRRPLTNFILIIQMLVIHIITIALVSSITSRYEEYTPFKSILNGEGYYYNMSMAFDPETKECLNKDQLAQKLKGNPEIICVYDPPFFVEVGLDTELCLLTLDDAVIRDYKFLLAEGEQIDLNKDYNGYVPVMISSNNLGYRVGMQIPYKQGDQERTALVVGVLQDFARVPIPVPVDHNGELSVHQFYTKYSTAVEEKLLIISAESLFTPYNYVVNGMVFVKYPNGVSENDQTENHEYMMEYGKVYQSAEFAILRHNSWRYIFSQCVTLLPVAAAVLILCITSILSMSALAAKRQIRDYAVYALCGLPWKSCIRIHAGEMLISTFAAYILTWIGMILCRPLYEDTVMRIGLPQILSGIFVMAFCMLAALILPRQLFRRSSVKTVLQGNE